MSTINYNPCHGDRLVYTVAVMNQNELERLIKRLCSHHDEPGYKAVKLLHGIVGNIISEPNNLKFQKLSTKSKSLQEALSVPNFSDILFGIGFSIKVEHFVEYWTLSRVNAITIAKLGDVLNFLGDIIQRYKHLDRIEESPKPLTRFGCIQDMQAKKKAYHDQLLAEAEQNRLEKLEREERDLNQLRRSQLHKKEKLEHEMSQLRSMLQSKMVSQVPLPLSGPSSSDDGEE